MGEQPRILPYATVKQPSQVARRAKVKRVVVGIVAASGFGAVAVYLIIWQILHGAERAENALFGIAFSVFGVVVGILIATGILR